MSAEIAPTAGSVIKSRIATAAAAAAAAAAAGAAAAAAAADGNAAETAQRHCSL